MAALHKQGDEAGGEAVFVGAGGVGLLELEIEGGEAELAPDPAAGDEGGVALAEGGGDGEHGAVGHGGVAYVTKLFGCHLDTVRQGEADIAELPEDEAAGRVRKKGGPQAS